MAEEAMMPIGKVLILLAADRLTGPAKGLFQFLHHARGGPWAFDLGLFHMRGTGPVSECARAADRLGVPHVILGQRVRFDPGLVWRAYWVVRAHGITLLQSHSYKGHLLCLLLRLLTGLSWIAFAHGWTDENRRVRLYNRLDFWLLRHSDRVVAVSDSVRRRLEATGVPSSRITVIRNAVEIGTDEPPRDNGLWRGHLGIPPEMPVLSVIGRLSPEKGQDVFLEACRLAAQKDCRFVGVLVGEGLWEHELRAKTKALGLESRVRFAGHCQDGAQVYAGSDVIVIPSRSEGLPNVLLEAMASAKPVVATHVGGIPEVLTDGVNGRLVPPEDPVRLADIMASLLADSQLRRTLAERASVDARSFSPQARAKRILSVYASTVRS
jgi:glycosyltransferase involved in cell wall biosynthesis